ncbi:uncharacterized protein PgNI_01381 [Pyricularia grisea]|uniref:Rhodopsin domain-containing protein n=1 Tax=Pyricularia grisea TaxID=148305 RepID=A0A6P8BMP9_PYRGI|nr:uncharacterized protein PgNI_01381 [Pyricularia grisea]TLD17762.1 hypothetical protein PgNI_01381 [Pyricularia grisea]
MEDRGGEIFLVAVIFLGLCWSAVLLRGYCRAWVIRSLGIDDQLMILTLVIFTCYLGVQIQAVHYGAGQHKIDLDPQNYSSAMELMYVSQILYIASTCILKISVGFFLLRISVKPCHIWAVRILMLVSLLFGVSYLMVVAMQCLPVSVFWEISPRDPYQCLPQNVLLVLTYCGSVINGLTDWGFGILPFFIVWSLSLPLKSRIMVIAILSFAMVGCSATIVRAIHVPRLLDADDFLYTTADVAIWSTVEPGIGITAASIATLRPLWELVCFRLGLRSEGPRATLWLDKLPDDKTGGLEAAPGGKSVDNKLSICSGGQGEPDDKLVVKVDAASSINLDAKDRASESSNKNYTHYISSSSNDGSEDLAVANTSKERTPKGNDSEGKRKRFLFASPSMLGLQVVPQGVMLDTAIHPHRRSVAAKSYSAQMDDVYEDMVHQMSDAFGNMASRPGSVAIPRDTLSTAQTQEDHDDDAGSTYSDTPRLDWKTPRISRFSLGSYWAGRISFWGGGRSRLSRIDSYGAPLQRRGTHRSQRSQRSQKSLRSRNNLNRENSHSSRHLKPRRMPSWTSSRRSAASITTGPLPPPPIEPVPEMPLRFLKKTESSKDDGDDGGGGGSVRDRGKI